jgi:hypothetical protein
MIRLVTRGRFTQDYAFAGIKPIRESFYGLTFSNERKRGHWIDDMRRFGERGS